MASAASTAAPAAAPAARIKQHDWTKGAVLILDALHEGAQRREVHKYCEEHGLLARSEYQPTQRAVMCWHCDKLVPLTEETESDWRCGDWSIPNPCGDACATCPECRGDIDYCNEADSYNTPFGITWRGPYRPTGRMLLMRRAHMVPYKLEMKFCTWKLCSWRKRGKRRAAVAAATASALCASVQSFFLSPRQRQPAAAWASAS